MITAVAEAIAVAIWLIPASVQIVGWPASGPVRLALLAPAWQLLALAFAAAVGALALGWKGRKDGRATTLAPLLLLWLWAVPFLPWLPDRAPLLLVLAGPLRWVIAAAAFAALFRPAHGLVRTEKAGRRAVFAVSLGVYLVFGFHSVRTLGLGGDEPHYLIITESLLKDHDLKIENNHQRGDYRSFYRADLRPDYMQRGKDGEIYSIHAPGLPAILLPVYALAGYLGAVALMCLIAALAALAIFDLAEIVAGRGAAVVTWAAVCLAVPFIPHAWLVFPEMPGALLVAWSALWCGEAVAGSQRTRPTVGRVRSDPPVRGESVVGRVLLDPPVLGESVLLDPPVLGESVLLDPPLRGESVFLDPPARIWFLRGLALAIFPWLHTKFAVFLAILTAALAMRVVRLKGHTPSQKPRALIALLAPIAVSAALWLYSFYALYGVFDPEAPYGAYTRTYVLTRNIPHGLIGLLLDQKFGLLFYSPIYLLSIAGAWLLLRRRDTRWLTLALLLTAIVFMATTARLYMFWGGSGAPARFLVPILPCLAPMVAAAFGALRRPAARAFAGLSLAIGWSIAAVGMLWPARLMLFSDPHGRARVLEALQAGSPLAQVVPTFTDPDWASQIVKLTPWMIAAAIAIGAVLAASRVAMLNHARTIACVATLTFLLAAGVLTARPDASTRETTAERGAGDVLWRFDGSRLRTFDYSAWRRADADRIREVSTRRLHAQKAGDLGYAAGPLALPAGAYDAVVWFDDARPRAGEIVVSASPRATFGRASGTLNNPATIPFELPVDVNRVSVRARDDELGGAIAEIRIVPRAVVPPTERGDINVRAIESIPGHDRAYIVYTDEHVYPEGGVFWTRGVAETRVFVAPGGAPRLRLTLSTGPMSGRVTVTAPGAKTDVTMKGGETQQVEVTVPAGARLVPLRIRSDVMFRPAEVDTRSTDMRGLGCQVRIDLE